MARTIVITGASSGIGAATATQLAARGDRVVLAARRGGELERLAARLGQDAFPVVTDVTVRADVEHLRDRAIERFGGIDVWINNAGRGLSKQTAELTDDELDQMMTVNVKSALYGMQAVLPHFIERGAGHIVNVSSFLSRVPMASIRAAYSASKAALNSLTANLRTDLAAAHPGIHVTLVMPGLVSTEFAQNAVHGTPPIRPGAGGAPAQTADEVAASIVGVVDQPVAEVFTNPALAGIARKYFEDVGAFEKGLR
ncbi:MAG TPA: SDR family NAD(P)-dependent oxidoreductase [Vicinamibacterales bacterium]|nr:SDR family NAD(P)-dependent oxidoreductase [Vicinamibacterales bacterium]